ncbi:MAG TPA: DUF962 domain-containing protein [Dyella sp.]|uniref:DUF962 domain-containing protein n=1 Tax=Dyella sp. TaxID=1869338 RepID=UPI002F91C515
MYTREENEARFAQLLDRYDQDHRQAGHRRLLALCLPLLLWSAIALVWTIPVPPGIGRPGLWSVGLQVLLFTWYWKHSRRLGLAMFIVMLALSLLTYTIDIDIAPSRLRSIATVTLLAGGFGVLAGRLLERPPLGLRDALAGLFVGPAWLLDRLLQRIGLGS